MLIRLAGVVTTMSGTLNGGGLLLDTWTVDTNGVPELSVRESATDLTWLHRAAFGHSTRAPGVILPCLLTQTMCGIQDIRLMSAMLMEQPGSCNVGKAPICLDMWICHEGVHMHRTRLNRASL